MTANRDFHETVREVYIRNIRFRLDDGAVRSRRGSLDSIGSSLLEKRHLTSPELDAAGDEEGRVMMNDGGGAGNENRDALRLLRSASSSSLSRLGTSGRLRDFTAGNLLEIRHTRYLDPIGISLLKRGSRR